VVDEMEPQGGPRRKRAGMSWPGLAWPDLAWLDGAAAGAHGWSTNSARPPSGRKQASKQSMCAERRWRHLLVACAVPMRQLVVVVGAASTGRHHDGGSGSWLVAGLADSGRASTVGVPQVPALSVSREKGPKRHLLGTWASLADYGTYY
jgi:hypothetical protein